MKIRMDYLGPHKIRCIIFSAFSASLTLRFWSSMNAFFPESPAPENHLGHHWLPDSDEELAGEDLIPATIIFSPCNVINSLI